MFAKKTLILAVAASLGLAACDDPYGASAGGDHSNAKSGAIAGALLGGFVGATRKGDDKLAKAATGAIIGGAIGGVIGNQLDKQARELQSEIGGNGTTITNTGSELIVTMPQDILFATDSAAVRPDLKNDLFAVADNLNRYPNTRVEVIGHTDNTGSAAYNQDLSQRRAAAVAQVLRDGGVTPARVVYYGRGEDQPIASNLTPEGRAQNRRVEIVIRPTQQ